MDWAYKTGRNAICPMLERAMNNFLSLHVCEPVSISVLVMPSSIGAPIVICHHKDKWKPKSTRSTSWRCSECIHIIWNTLLKNTKDAASSIIPVAPKRTQRVPKESSEYKMCSHSLQAAQTGIKKFFVLFPEPNEVISPAKKTNRNIQRSISQSQLELSDNKLPILSKTIFRLTWTTAYNCTTLYIPFSASIFWPQSQFSEVHSC